MTEKKKRRRRSTFATALAQSKSRLQKAQQELEAAQKLVAALSVEIPLLRHTAEALERQINPEPNKSTPLPFVGAGLAPLDALPAGIGPRTDAAIPYNRQEPIEGLSEDDLLPEPEGQELLES